MSIIFSIVLNTNFFGSEFKTEALGPDEKMKLHHQIYKSRNYVLDSRIYSN